MPTSFLSPWILISKMQDVHVSSINDVTFHIDLFLVTMDTIMNNAGSKYQ